MGFVAHRCECEPRRKAHDVIIGHRPHPFDHLRNARRELEQQTLTRDLSEGKRFHRRKHLVLEPRHDVTADRRIARNLHADCGQRERRGKHDRATIDPCDRRRIENAKIDGQIRERRANLLGFGTEWMITRNWTAFVEYNCIEFDKKNERFPINPLIAGPGVAFNADLTNKLSLAKVGVNYKFDWGTPVVAKY